MIYLYDGMDLFAGRDGYYCMDGNFCIVLIFGTSEKNLRPYQFT